MKIKTMKLIYFSPTQTTKRIVEEIGRGISLDQVERIDLTLPEAVKQPVAPIKDALAIIGIPVYGGRVPLEAIERLQRLQGQNVPAIIVAVYGNRAFEDALLELKDLVSSIGFRPIAAGAFIGEHSFSDDATPVAPGRPDVNDLQKAREFGKAVSSKLAEAASVEAITPLSVPGDFPYKERKPRSNMAPMTHDDLCIQCETCVAVCPVAAVSLKEVIETDAALCILCCACVKNCPTTARKMENPGIRKAAEWLVANFSARKEPEIFI